MGKDIPVEMMTPGEEMYLVYRMSMLEKAPKEDTKKYPRWENLSDQQRQTWDTTAIAARKGIPYTKEVEPVPEVEEVDRSNEFKLLSSDEWDVYSYLSKAYNLFTDLPVLFKDDTTDFIYHINALKSILMSRPVEKEMLKRNRPGYGDRGKVRYDSE